MSGHGRLMSVVVRKGKAGVEQEGGENMIYKWSIGLYSKVDANDAGKELERIEKETGGISNHDVVDAARPEGSVLHDLFEWDDKKAGDKWRLVQASNIISALIVVNEDSQYNKRAFVNITKSPMLPKNKPRYIRIDNAIQDENTRKILLNNAKEELRRFREKYRALKELTEIFDLINKL